MLNILPLVKQRVKVLSHVFMQYCSIYTRDHWLSSWSAPTVWSFLFLSLPFLLLTVLTLCWCIWAFSSCCKQGLLSSCSGQASHGSGFSCCGARGLTSCGSQALEHRLSSCGSLAYCSVARGIVLSQGSNRHLLRWPEDSLPLSHQESPWSFLDDLDFHSSSSHSLLSISLVPWGLWSPHKHTTPLHTGRIYDIQSLETPKLGGSTISVYSLAPTMPMGRTVFTWTIAYFITSLKSIRMTKQFWKNCAENKNAKKLAKCF